MHGVKLGGDGQVTSTFIYGRNLHSDGEASQSALLESETVFDRHITLFGRAELVQKSADELQLSAFTPSQLFRIGALSLGYVRELTRGSGVTFGVGACGTANVVPSALEGSYGSRTPLGGMVFVRLRPYHSQPHAAMTMKTSMPTMKHEH